MEPIQIAVEKKDLDIALLLMKYGADVKRISDGTAKDTAESQQKLPRVSAIESITWISMDFSKMEIPVDSLK